jgi:hypothetical protein
VNARLRSPAWLLEAFVAANLLVLVADVALAHSVNAFHHPAEWVPLAFSAPAGLLIGGLLLTGDPRQGSGRWIGEVVGWGAVGVGVAGLLWHLSGEFFDRATLASLVYSAPFVAPLAFTGLGLLLLLNRRSDAARDPAWGRWVLFLALAGIAGNFGLALTDHARNGFFDAREWIAVVAAAAGVGGVSVAVFWPRSGPALRVAWVALGIQVAAGGLGFVLHNLPLVAGPATGDSLWARVVFGPPALAPLLFANLAVPAALGLWALGRGASGAAPGT